MKLFGTFSRHPERVSGRGSEQNHHSTLGFATQNRCCNTRHSTSEILDKECREIVYIFFMDTSYNNIIDFQLIPYKPPPTLLLSPETNSIIQGYTPKNDNTTNISTGGNDPTQTNSQLLSQITSNPSKQASTVPFTDGPLLKKLSVVGSISSAIQIKFNYFSSSFTTFTVVAKPIASILSGPLAIVTQNIPISDTTGCTDITKNQHIYTITGLNQGTQYKLSLTAINYFKRQTTLIYPNVATNQPPDPPTNLQIASLTDYTADIMFTPPVQIIDTYIANVYSGSRFMFSERFEVPKGTRVKLPLTVTGLNFHVYYTITFFAVNSDGLSQGSTPITFETPQIPDAPTNLFSPSQTSVSIDLSFNPPLQYVQYYTLMAFDMSNNQVFNQNIDSHMNKYSVTGLMTNRPYTIRVYSYNSDGISPTYAALIAETLPILTSVSFGEITSTSIQFINLIGIYYQINVQRNIGSPEEFDGSFNISSTMATYNDNNLIPNTQYTYIFTPVNSFGIANVSFVLSPKYTYSSGFIRGCTNISSFYLQINFIGYYSSANIIRTGGTFIPGDTSSNFPNSNSPQTDVTAFVTDTSLKANTPYTYTVTIYNGDGVPNILSTNIGATTLCVVYNASFGIITNNSIQISDISGVYSKLTIIRAGGITGYVSHDIINTTDTSYNDTGLFPNILYKYILIHYALNTNYNTSPPRRYYLPGVQYNSLGFGTYTRPTLTNAAFSNTTYNSISLYQITGIFDRVHIVRTTQGISVPTAIYDICSNVVSFTDISGLMPNSLNSYTLTSYNPNNLTGDIINLSVYTDASGYILPCIATGINTLKLQWTGYDSSVSIIRSGGGIFTPTLANNYPTSANPQSFVGGYVTDSGLVSNLPYTYNVTLYNGNSKPTVITTTIGNTTLPRITAASFGTITTTTQLIQGISGNYSTVVINQTNKTNSVTSNAVATISGNSTTIGGLSSNNNYAYSLIPFNGLGVSGSTFLMTELYTLPSITSSSFGSFTATSLSLQNIVGSYKYIKVDRYTRGIVTPSYNIITVNSPDTSGVDLSLNPNTQYTYYLTPYNPNDTSGATYITSRKYTDVSVNVLSPSNVTSSSLQLNLYGTYSNVAISRDIVGGQFQTNYTSSSPQIINTSYVTDTSVNTNTFYKYTFQFKNGDALTNIPDISQTVLTLPTITSVQYSGHSYNSLKLQLSGQYNTVRVYRVDVSNNTTTTDPVNIIAYLDTSYNDTGLSPNYRYQYKCVPYNINDISGIPVTSTPKYTDASGKTMPFSNVTNYSTQINWMGYYSGILINRYKDGLQSDITFGTPSLYTTPFTNITDPYAQSLLTGYAQDMNVIQNVTYTYKFILYNGDGLSSELPAIYLTNLPSITSTPVFGIVTPTSISITNVNGICNSIDVNRTDEFGFTTVFNVPNITTIYDTSVNFTSRIIPYDAKYTYSLTPLGITGASGDTVDVPGFIYTLPKLDSVSYGIVDASSIQFNLFTGSYEYIQVDRYFGDITQPQSNTLQKKNAFTIVKGQSIYNDIGLLTDVSYSYRFTPFNLSVPNVSGTAITLNVIYTKPYLQSAIYKTPTYTSIPIDISSSICTSVTINRYKAGPILETSYDVPYTSTINDISFTNNIVPYDVSYTYTLIPKNRVGTYGTPYSGLGTIYTLPLINSATFSTITSDTIAIIINASCTSITVNRNDPNNINTTSYDVSYAPIIYDTSMKFIGNIIPPSVIYNYILTPKNRVGLAGTPYNIPAQLYTLPVITSATFGTITSTSIPIYVTGTGKSITINRIDPNNINTKSYDVAFANGNNIIYDNSVNFVGYVIPYNVGYTYSLTPKNLNDASGYTYNVGQIYSLPSITSAQYKTPTYQTIPIDISSSVGLCNSIRVTRYLGGYVDTTGTPIFDVSYATTINDVSTNFTNQIIPYNRAYTYKLSPKNPNGVYGTDISLGTIYTLPTITSAQYKTPTSQTIPIDISSSVGLCTKITVIRKKGGATDTSGIPIFDVSNASIIYDVSGNFSNNIIPYDASYTYNLIPFNAVGVSGTIYNNLGIIYSLPSITSASYGDISANYIKITNIIGKYESINITRNVLDINNNIISSVTNALQIPYPVISTTVITDSSGIQGLNANTKYSYTIYANNGSGQSAVFTMSGIYTLAQGSLGTITSTLTSNTLTWSGIYSRLTINRNIAGATFNGISNYPTSGFPQSTANGSANDSTISSGSSNTYTIYLFNGSDVSINIGSFSSTPISNISATYGTITSSSIYLLGFTGSYTTIKVTRNIGIGYGVYDTSYTINYPDTSYNDTGLKPNTSYSYSLLPFNAVGVSGSYYNITPRNIYTSPNITNVAYSASADTINFTTIDGSYSYVTFKRYQNNIVTYDNSNVNGAIIYSDTGLFPDTSYRYQFIPWGSGSPTLSGDIFYVPSSGVINTLPRITSATFGTPTATQIPINVVAGCTSITIGRYDPIGTNTKSYDVSNAAIIYDNSINFTNSTIPYDVSYTYTLTPKNSAGVAGTPLVVGTIYTIPNIATATSTVIDVSSIQISVTGSYASIKVDTYNGTTLSATNTYNKSQFPVTDTNLTIDTSYNYILTPFNESVPNISGSYYSIPAKYTYGNISSASLVIVNSSTLQIQSITGTYDGIYYTRTGGGSTINSTISTPVTVFTDPSMLIPDTSYTYVVAALNKSGDINNNTNATKNLTTYTDASGYIINITDISSSSVKVNWAGYCNSGVLMYTNSNSAVNTTNIFSPVDGQLRTGYAIDTSGGAGLTPNNLYIYTVYFTNYNGRIINSSPVSTFTLAYYSDASVNAIDSTSLRFSWRGYYSDISNVYQNGLLITPDTSNNTRPSNTNIQNSGSVTKTGLNPNTSYYYDVSLINTAGVVAGISRKSAFTCASGSSLTPTPIDSTQIQVNWTGIYSTALVTSTGGSISTTNKNNYTSSTSPQANIAGNVYNTGLTNNTQYTYAITLYNGNNVATSLTSTSAYTKPIAPTTLTASSVTDTTLTLGFTSASTSATSLAYTTTGTNAGSISGTPSNTSGSTFSASVISLPSNSSYSINVICTNITSTLSATSTTPVTGYTLPRTPTITAATTGTTTTSLTFTVPTGTINSYTLTGTTGLTVTAFTTSPIYISGMTQNMAYSFILSATNSTSAKTSATSTFAFNTDPSAPTGFTGTSTSSSVSLTWTYPSSYKWTYNISIDTTESTDKTTGSYSVSSLTSNTSYSYSLKIKGLSGNYSSSVSYSIYTYPDSFTVSTSDITTTTCTLTISTTPSGTITYSLSGGGTLGTKSSNTFPVTGLTANTSYTLTLTATGGGNFASTATTDSFYTYPESFTVSASDITATTCILTISATPSGTITYSLSGGGTLGTKSSNTFPVTGLTANTSYTLTLTATGGGGQYSKADTSSFTTTAADGYRYYRIGVDHIANGGGVLVAWANWQFFSDAAGTISVNTPTSSSSYTLYNSSLTNPISHVTDQNMNSIIGGFSSTGKYCFYVTNTSNITSDGTVSPESGCVIDFGSVVSIHSYIWYTSNDSPPRDPTSWKLYGSSDNSNWTTLHTGTSSTNSARNARILSTGYFSF